MRFCQTPGIVGFIIVLAVATCAVGEEPLYGTSRTMDPRTLGLAGASLATPSSVSGLYLNPATIAMAHIYHLNLMYQYTGQENMHMGGIAIVDSVTSSTIAAGLAVNYLAANHDHTHHQSWDGRLAVGGNIGDVFFIGLTGRYIRVEHDLKSADLGPNGRPAMPSSGSQQVDGFTFDAGAALNAGNVLRIGVTGYNLSNTDSIYAPLQLGSGVAVSLVEMLNIEADVVFDFTSHEKVNEEIRAGLELLVAGRVPLRLGYLHDVYYHINSIAAGVGYLDKAFAIDLGYSQELRQGGRFQLALGVRIFIG